MTSTRNHGNSSHKQAYSCAEPTRADLQAIRHVTADEALEAAKRLGSSAAFNAHGPEFLEQDGIVCDMLKMFDVPNLSCQDLEALHSSMMYLVSTQPRLAAEVVALCADPDLRVAFAALDCTKRLLLDNDCNVTQHMMQSGAAPAIVAALKHSDAYFRAAAASFFAVGSYIDVPTYYATAVKTPSLCSMKALQEAGLLPALMDVVREGRSGNVHDRTTGVFENIKMELRVPDKPIVLPYVEPAPHACHSLLLLTMVVGDMKSPLHSFALDVVAELVKMRKATARLVRCVRQFDDDVLESPAKTIKNLLTIAGGLQGDRYRCLQDAQRRAFAKELLTSGLQDLLPTLIRPEQPYRSGLMLCCLLETFWALGDNCLPSKSLAPLAAAIVKFMEEGPCDDHQDEYNAVATSCLEKVSWGLGNNGLPPMQLSLRCIKRMAGVALTGTRKEALTACTLIAAGAVEDKSYTVLKAAMSGGFVPGILRVARDGHRKTDADFPHNLVTDSFTLIVQSGEERYILQAVKSGLLAFLEFYIGMPQYQKPALSVCAKLLEYPWAPAKLREAGFVSSVTRAAHSVVELGRWVCTTCPGSGLLADFVDAGLLEKLEKAKRQMKRQPVKQRDVATVIDELSRLRGLGSPDSPEAGSGPVQDLCLVNAKDKAVGNAATSTARANKRPDPKRDRPTSKNSGKQGGACIQCGKSPVDGVELFLCSRCKSVMYCGRECQRSHWRLHKAECSALRAES